jgi:adenylate kinase
MSKKVIIITGTPCVGKTSVAHLLSAKLEALYINLTDLARDEKLILGKDENRNSIIVNESRMKRKIRQIAENSRQKNIVVDGHYAASVVSKELVKFAFVLRRDPVELKGFMKRCGFAERKLNENLAAEILDVCLVDTLKTVGEGKVCELDVTGKTAEEIADEILKILSGKGICRVGVVDWLGKLESEGALEDFLKL